MVVACDDHFGTLTEIMDVQRSRSLFLNAVRKVLLFFFFGFLELIRKIAFSTTEQQGLILIDTKHFSNKILMDLKVKDNPQLIQLS